MNKLEFSLKNYHSIENADIFLNGITVLSGVNGCGKSTILRWLYYSIMGLKEFKNYAVKEYANNLLDFIFSEIDLGFDRDTSIDSKAMHNICSKYGENFEVDDSKRVRRIGRYRTGLNSYRIFTEEYREYFNNRMFSLIASSNNFEDAINEINDYFYRLVNIYKEALLQIDIEENSSSLMRYKSRIFFSTLSYIEMDNSYSKKLDDIDDHKLNELILKVKENRSINNSRFNKYDLDFDSEILFKIISLYCDLFLSSQIKNIKKSDYSLFSSLVKNKYEEIDDVPKNIVLKEFETELLGSDVPFFKQSNIENIFYIDTPIVIGDTEGFIYSSYIWRHKLFSAMSSKQSFDFEDYYSFILDKIKNTIQGSVRLMDKKDKGFFLGNKEFEFVSSHGVSFDFKRVATGIKSFSYLQRLIENGFLNEKSMLLIDEPEAHLHPQWIVIFAYLLVLLQKLLNVTVVIASHSPDMVQSIQEIALKEGLEDKTRFYFAKNSSQKNNDNYSFVFADDGFEINKIFKGFNKAFLDLEEITQS